MLKSIIAVGVVVAALASCSEARAETGGASFYTHGRRTANGERFNPNGMTAAHKHLPFGSHVRVTDAHTGRSVVVRINDRGPFVRGRIIDLAGGAARALGMAGRGVAHVHVVVLN